MGNLLYYFGDYLPSFPSCFIYAIIIGIVFSPISETITHMKKENKHPDEEENIKTNLKHDNMEYSAATDGDDIVDEDFEEDEISEAELDQIETSPEDEAYALDSVESDLQIDEDIITEEDWTDDIEEDDDDELNHHRNDL